MDPLIKSQLLYQLSYAPHLFRRSGTKGRIDRINDHVHTVLTEIDSTGADHRASGLKQQPTLGDLYGLATNPGMGNFRSGTIKVQVNQ